MERDNARGDALEQRSYLTNYYPQRQAVFPQHQPILLPSKINAIDYNMSHKNRGHALIFDVENFHKRHGLPSRGGSQADSTGLYNLFRSMSFQVSIFKDCTAKQILSQLEVAAKADHSDNDCFVCCFLTHGEYGQLWAHDAKFPIDALFKQFLGDNCPTLVGKPKLFFIQACQGDRLDSGVNVVGQAIESRESYDSAAYFKIPTHADFLIAYSTLPGFYSWRNTADGSWFIQAVVQVFNQYHHELDVLTMLTIVNHRVAYYKCSNSANPETSQKKQVPCITSMLTRRVFLRPKEITI